VAAEAVEMPEAYWKTFDKNGGLSAMTIRIPSVTVFPDKAPPKVGEQTYVKVKEEPEVEVEELVPLSAVISVRLFFSEKNSKLFKGGKKALFLN
jgi:hypothetical protein